jgi:hypothetical protein
MQDDVVQDEEVCVHRLELADNGVGEVIRYWVEQCFIDVEHLVAVGVEYLERGYSLIDSQARVDTIGADAADAVEDAVVTFGPDYPRVSGDEQVQLPAGVQAGAGREDDVKESHGKAPETEETAIVAE